MTDETTVPPAEAAKVKVFISWSGKVSRGAASALRNWLPMVVNAVEPYMSEQDIAKGSRWFEDILVNLTDSDYGIICVTPDNLQSRWLYFEAGALATRFGKARVCPFLIGVSEADLPLPLSLYQAATCEKGSVKQLLDSLNELCRREGSALETSFEALWEKLGKSLSGLVSVAKERAEAAGAESEPPEGQKYDERLDELLVMMRDLQRSVNSPETLLPLDYVRQLGLRLRDDRPVAREAVRQLENRLRFAITRGIEESSGKTDGLLRRAIVGYKRRCRETGQKPNLQLLADARRLIGRSANNVQDQGHELRQ